jgi:hypothetical protein
VREQRVERRWRQGRGRRREEGGGRRREEEGGGRREEGGGRRRRREEAGGPEEADYVSGYSCSVIPKTAATCIKTYTNHLEVHLNPNVTVQQITVTVKPT